MYIAGIDEAGRGPVIGPLVIAGVVFRDKDLIPLKESGLTDSKLLSKMKRTELFNDILKSVVDYKVIIIEACTIDSQRNNAISLNRIEFNAMVEILSTLKFWSKAFVDACDRNAEKFQTLLQNKFQQNIVAEHFADFNYPVVSAASVVAKVIRDKEIVKHHKECGVNFGSGYPCDSKTCEFIRDYYKKNGDLPSFVRKSWETSQKILRTSEQKNLDDYLK